MKSCGSSDIFVVLGELCFNKLAHFQKCQYISISIVKNKVCPDEVCLLCVVFALVAYSSSYYEKAIKAI